MIILHKNPKLPKVLLLQFLKEGVREAKDAAWFASCLYMIYLLIDSIDSMRTQETTLSLRCVFATRKTKTTKSARYLQETYKDVSFYT
jgi:hypothetical protein